MWSLPKVKNGYASTSTSGASATSATWSAATATIRASSCGASATRSWSRPSPTAGRSREASRRHLPRGRPDPADHRRLQQIDGAIRNGLAAQVDMPGFNYKPHALRADPAASIPSGSSSARRRPPASARAASITCRSKNIEKHPSLQITELRRDRAALGVLPGRRVRGAGQAPERAGRVRLDGFDYLGEPTPYFAGRAPIRTTGRRAARTSASSTSPASRRTATTSIRACGPTSPMVHVLPHWNWAGHEGQTIPVMAYTNADGGRAVPERQIAGPQETRRGARRDPRRPERQRRPRSSSASTGWSGMCRTSPARFGQSATRTASRWRWTRSAPPARRRGSAQSRTGRDHTPTARTSRS